MDPNKVRGKEEAFRKWISEIQTDISELNKIAGTDYKSHDEIGIGDDNRIIRSYSGRFRPWLVYEYYQRGACSIAREKACMISICH